MHKSPEFGPEMLWGGFYQAARGQDFPLHRHAQWELVYYLEGEIECVQEKRHFAGKPGLLWLTPPDTAHAEIAHTAYRNIYFSVRAPRRTGWPATVMDDEDRNLERLCRALVQEARKEKEGDRILMRLMLQELLRRVVRVQKGSPGGTATLLVQRAEAEFFARLDQPLGIAEVAKKIGASPSGLRLAFQNVRGESPRACLRRLRCQQALYWLQFSTHSLESIADLSGFDSASHLSRVMLKEMGQRPGQLRRGSGKAS